MGRPRAGWHLRAPRDSKAFFTVRFTINGQFVERSTGETDPRKASEAAAQIYARALTAPAPRRSVVGRAMPLDALFASYLSDLTTTHDVRTVQSYEAYARKFVASFRNDLYAIHRAALADYQRERLGQVLVRTLRKEKSFLNGFLLWCVEQGELSEDRRPTWPAVPKRAIGVRVGPQRATSVQVTLEQVAAFLSELPEWSRQRASGAHAIRARFVFAYETGLRPATIDAISVPTHWKPGDTYLQIRAEDDKARYARRIPLSPAACAALEQTWADQRHKGGPLVFGAHDFREVFEGARVRAGIPAGFAPYDLRHARVQHLLDRGVPLRAVMLLVGHRQMTTTNAYIQSDERAAADAVSFRAVFGPWSPSIRAKEGNRTLTGVTPPEPESGKYSKNPANSAGGRGQKHPKNSDHGPSFRAGPETKTPKKRTVQPWVQEATIALLSRLAGVSS